MAPRLVGSMRNSFTSAMSARIVATSRRVVRRCSRQTRLRRPCRRA
ncbi:MAG TPA: hypothetical protein VHZ78_09225 [Rhizomicrobium sp.]|nr:hypothetical protein [Rhizomicrobium sp.]